MKKIILLSLVCTGLVVTPFGANALDAQKTSENLAETTNGLLAQYRQNHNRQFSVYYRKYRERQWTLEGYHTNRRDAERAANRLQRRGFRTYVQVSREINRGMGRNR